MKKFFALMAVVLAVVSCQKDVDNLDVNVGGAVDTVITVNIPENETRADDSGIGVFENGILESNDYTMRYIFQVYYNDETNEASRQVMYTDRTSVSFPVRLVPGRDYQFVVWADVVMQGGKSLDQLGVYEASADLHYNTAELTNITLSSNPSTWVAMDETRDAFTATYEAKQFNGAQTINIDLYRPFAKLRVVTTDYDVLNNMPGGAVVPDHAVVTYYTKHRSAFNAYTSKAEAADLSGVEHENYTIATYTRENNTKRTIFSDYFFAENDVVKFEMTVYDTNGDEIVTRMFNTDIYAKRNHLTTLLGNILTDGNDINIEVKPGFGGTENPNINYNVITSGSELLEAIENGGSYMVGNDIYVSAPVASTLATRAAAVEPTTTTTTINLNGYTITVTNKTDAPFATVAAGNTLFLEGGDIVLTEGSTASFIKNNGNVVLSNGTLENESNSGTAAVVEGKVIAEENTNATVNDNNTTKVENWLTDVLANGGTYLFTDDMTSSEKIVVTAKNPVVLDGNGKTLTSTADRAINVDGATADVTIKNLNIVASGERAINVINGSKKVTIENVTAKAANYTVNVAGSAPNATVVINNSDLTGLNTVNIAGEKTTVTITNTKITTDDQNDGENYGAISVNSNGTNSTVTVNGGEIVVHGDSVAAGISGDYSVVTFNDTIGATNDDVVYYNFEINYGDNAYTFTSLNDALNIAKDNEEVTVVRSFSVSEPLVIEEGQIATINLNGKTIGSMKDAIEEYSIYNYGTLTIKGEGNVYGIVYTESAETTINGGTYNPLENGKWVFLNNMGKLTINGGTINKCTTYPIYSYNEGNELVINDVTINASFGCVNAYGTNGSVVINGGTFNMTGVQGNTSHIVYLSQNITATINGGTFEKIGNINMSATGGGGICVNGSANLTINNGNFAGDYSDVYNYKGTISIKGGTYKFKPSFVATDYKAIEKNGKYVVVPADAEVVSTADELVAALAAGEDVFFMNDITVAASEGGYNKAGILQNKAQTIDGNGYTLTVTGAGATWDCAIYTNGGTIKNLTVAGAMRGIFTAGQSSDLNIENVTFKNVIYTFTSDGKMPTNPFGVYVSDSNVNGWTSHSNMHTEVVYTNCSFGEGSGYKYCRPYGKTSFVNCTFCAGYTIDESETTEITYTDCTFEE